MLHVTPLQRLLNVHQAGYRGYQVEIDRGCTGYKAVWWRGGQERLSETASVPGMRLITDFNIPCPSPAVIRGELACRFDVRSSHVQLSNSFLPLVP